MAQDTDKSLLNMGCLDVGLYTIADVIPEERFFQTNGIGFDEMFEEQNRYVKEGLSNYIVTCDFEPEHVYDKYDLIRSKINVSNGYEYTYYLFKRK